VISTCPNLLEVFQWFGCIPQKLFARSADIKSQWEGATIWPRFATTCHVALGRPYMKGSVRWGWQKVQRDVVGWSSGAARRIRDLAVPQRYGRWLLWDYSIQSCMKIGFLNSGNACYHLVQNLLYSRLLPKELKIEIYKTIILPAVLHGYEN